MRTNGGLQQLLKWGGGSYQLTIDGARNTTSNAGSRFQSAALVQSQRDLHAAAAAQLHRSINLRQQLLTGQKKQEIVDLQLQQRLTQTARTCAAPTSICLARSVSWRSRSSRSTSRNESLQNNKRRVEVGTIPPIDIVEAQAEVSRNEEAVIVTRRRSSALEDRAPHAGHEPVAARFLDGTRLVPSEQPVLTPHAGRRGGGIRTALAQRTDLAQLRRQMDQTDISIKYSQNQKLPCGRPDRPATTSSGWPAPRISSTTAPA